MFAKDSGCQVVLNVVGNGTQTENLKKAGAPENLKIVWHGYLGKESIAPLLQKSHLFLHASGIETFSIVTAEALSTGTPVVVSDRGALPELVQGHNGILAENNVESWNKKICEIINRRFDNELIAQENQSRFSAAIIGRSVLEEYNKVLNEIV
jgi:alpha-1,6-mannosyltransferase